MIFYYQIFLSIQQNCKVFRSLTSLIIYQNYRVYAKKYEEDMSLDDECTGFNILKSLYFPRKTYFKYTYFKTCSDN